MRPSSKEIRLLQNKWQVNTNWPKRLESIEIHGVRGWTGQRIEFDFPMMAICGENGSGKSTILQAAAAVYQAKAPDNWYASDFYPDTAWDKIRSAQIKYRVRQGNDVINNSVRKPTTRWRGNQKRPERPVKYVDLSRIQPVAARTGYARLAKPKWKEVTSVLFDRDKTLRLSEIMGRIYANAKMAATDGDTKRSVPVIHYLDRQISGYHQGAGELTMMEFLGVDFPKYSLVLIDEIETSLHPRAQRRLIRRLAEMCRERELQIIVTTHSPYVLSELPPEARVFIMETGKSKEVMHGVSPEFAMTKMDEELHPECDLYVEDERSSQMLREIIVQHGPEIIKRVQIIPFGAANVGQALGQMVANDRFPRPSLVFLDGDQPEQTGCLLLPGQDAPERVVFGELHQKSWGKLHERTGRPFSEISDACSRVLTVSDHKEWILSAATHLLLGGDVLWQAMCAEWSQLCLDGNQAGALIDKVREKLM
jgi:predicted ATPase